MAKTKAERTERVTVTIPSGLVRISKAAARGGHQSLSAFVAQRIRDYFQSIERVMR